MAHPVYITDLEIQAKIYLSTSASLACLLITCCRLLYFLLESIFGCWRLAATVDYKKVCKSSALWIMTSLSFSLYHVSLLIITPLITAILTKIIMALSTRQWAEFNVPLFPNESFRAIDYSCTGADNQTYNKQLQNTTKKFVLQKITINRLITKKKLFN